MTNFGPLGSASFWIDTCERSVRAFAQGTLIALGLGAANNVYPGVTLSVPWPAALIAGVSFSALTALTCLSSLTIPGADSNTGSFLKPPPDQLPKLHAWFEHRHPDID